MSLDRTRGLLNALGAGILGDVSGAFGTREQVAPVRHLLGTAGAWGGNPPEAAEYSNGVVNQNDGQVPYALTAMGFVWINTPGNSRLDQIAAGRGYLRAALRVTNLGLAM